MSPPIDMAMIGMRPVFDGPDVSVYEKRGGTHLLLMRCNYVLPGAAPFDLMVEDLHKTHRQFKSLGLNPSAIEGRAAINHEIFTLREPSVYLFTVFSSNACGAPKRLTHTPISSTTSSEVLAKVLNCRHEK
jgi:hypothetical protein